ncbi:hypothetical protein OsJ_11609 [Oryza sativa Japonica Group]|uniref:Secreted protein n=1 Tax=Oryza sativa subsp. japonica TaxID=39947 RepID=B9F9I8_ORYSJ|nr:hypothetical protein OsJ_11609 [Oryza sativa Japonica Group]
MRAAVVGMLLVLLDGAAHHVVQLGAQQLHVAHRGCGGGPDGVQCSPMMARSARSVIGLPISLRTFTGSPEGAAAATTAPTRRVSCSSRMGRNERTRLALSSSSVQIPRRWRHLLPYARRIAHPVAEVGAHGSAHGGVVRLEHLPGGVGGGRNHDAELAEAEPQSIRAGVLATTT